MNLEPRVAMKAMNELARQADELDGKRRILALAIRDVETQANAMRSRLTDPIPELDTILHICRTGGVLEAMSSE